MTGSGLALALAALVPLMLGPPSQQPAQDSAFTVALCNGGTITLDLGLPGERERDQRRDCHQKGCHAGACREKAKPRAGHAPSPRLN